MKDTFLQFSLVSLCLLSAACSAEPMNGESGEDVAPEELAASHQELTNACGTFASQFTFNGFASTFASGNYAVGCQGDTIGVDIFGYSSGYQKPRFGPAARPSNPTDCVNTEIRILNWDITTNPPTSFGFGAFFGTWNPGGGLVDPHCAFGREGTPGYSTPVGSFIAGRSYRIGAQVKRAGRLVNVEVSHPRQPR